MDVSSRSNECVALWTRIWHMQVRRAQRHFDIDRQNATGEPGQDP